MPGKGDRFYMLLGFRLVKPKHEIVGIRAMDVHADNELCRICARCGKLTEWCANLRSKWIQIVKKHPIINNYGESPRSTIIN